MANNYEQIMALVNAGNKMGLSNAITRDNGIPLDLSSVYNTYEDAVVYAATKAIAYQNQVIAAEGIVYVIVAESLGKVKIGEVEYDNYLKPVGTAPSGDDASISVTSEGLVSILGFATAQDGTLPVRENGALTWKTLEAIGAGDGNDNTTYTFALNNDKNGIVVTPLFNGQPIMEGEGEEATQVKYHLDLDVYTKGEVDTAIANAVDGLVDEDALAGAIGSVEAKIPTVPDNVGAFKNDAGYLVANDIAGKADKADTYTKEEVNKAINTAVEGILGEDVKEAYNTLKEIQDILDGTDGEAIDGLIEVADANKQALEVLNGAATVEGSVAKQIADAVAPLVTQGALTDILSDYNEEVQAGISSQLIDYALIQDVNSVLVTKADQAEIQAIYNTLRDDVAYKATTLEGYGITDAYTTEQIDEKIGAPGVPAVKDSEGNVTTEAIPGTGVFANTYSKEELKALLDEVEGSYTESVASVARQLDEYKTSNNNRVKNIEDKVGKDVNGEEPATGLFLEVDEARKVADEAKSASAQNANNITTLQGQLGTTNSTVSGIQTRLSALETEVGVVEKSRIDAIEGILNGSEEADGLVAIVTGHSIKIGQLEAADSRIEKKADDNATAILALQNKVDTGDKTVTAYVAEEIGKIKPYDDTVIKELITAEETRATSIEAGLRTDVDANTAAIALLNDEAIKEGSVKHTVATELAKIISDDDADIDTLNEIAAWIINDKTGAAKMANDIAALNIAVDTGDKKVSEYVADAIAAIPAYTLPAATVETLGGIKSAADVDGKAAVNKVYVDADGNAEVNAVSTDNLVQGTMTLVLDGGSAID